MDKRPRGASYKAQKVDKSPRGPEKGDKRPLAKKPKNSQKVQKRPGGPIKGPKGPRPRKGRQKTQKLIAEEARRKGPEEAPRPAQRGSEAQKRLGHEGPRP